MTKKKAPEDKLKVGRPTTYSKEAANHVCQLIARHPFGLKKLHRMFEGFPEDCTIYNWLFNNPEFARQYYEAKRAQADAIANSMQDDADEVEYYIDKNGVKRIDPGILGKAKLQCDVKRWHTAKMAPKIYGDQNQLDAMRVENEQNKAEIEKLRAELAEKAKKDY